jgi:O-antigen ligase/Tfp pilus assembly protein PilF
VRRLPWLLLLAALSLPALALAPRSQHVFWLPESALTLILVPFAALLAWWSTRGLAHPTLPKNLWRTFGVLWVLWVLSAALAFRPDLSLLALAEWSCQALLFFALWRLAADEKRRSQAVVWLLLYGVLSTAYAALQLAGGDSTAWTTQFGGRTGAFLGNPNFLGGHLALLFPVALALALDRRQKKPGLGPTAWPWALVLILGAGLLMTQTRGAWLGAGAGAVVVLILAQRHMGTLVQRNRPVLLSLGAVALLGLAFYFVQRPQAWARIADTFDAHDTELSRRGFLMEKAARVAALQPVLGTGPGNFRIQFARVQVRGLDPKAYGTQPYVVGEHAHNDFLQLAAETGWPAALLWALLMVLVLRSLYESFTQSRPVRGAAQSGLLGLGVLGAVTALLIHGLANFPFLILPTEGAAWALVALVLRSQARPTLEAGGAGLIDEPSAPVPQPHPAGVDNGRVAWLGLGLGLAICVASVAYNGRRLALDRLWWIGQGELQLNHFDAASGWLMRALAFDRREDRLWALQGRAQEGQGQLNQSIDSLGEAHRLAPYDAEVAVHLGRNLVAAKRYDEAEYVLRGVSLYAPNYSELWDPLAAALFFQGKYAEAVQTYDQMIDLQVNAENAYINKAAAQGSQGQLAEALLTLQQAADRYPDKPKLYMNEAITYWKLGQKPAARAALQQAARLDPNDSQLDALRKALR